MVTVYVAIGSNVGDRIANLQQAIDRLKDDVRLQAASAVYETVPMYVENQPSFLNAALSARTDLAPHTLLAVLKRIEREVGRQDRPRYGPREVDLDLIAYGILRYRYTLGGQVVLQLPHPRTGERRFVLQPLSDIDPSLILPGIGPVSELLDLTSQQAGDVARREGAVLSI